MTPREPERRVPLDFAPAIAPGQRLVGFRVDLAEQPLRESARIWRLRLKCAVLPRGIHERALAQGAGAAALLQHPDAYWTSVDPGFLAQPSGTHKWVGSESDEFMLSPTPLTLGELRIPHRRSCAILMPSELSFDPQHILWLLNDPQDYRWPELKSLMLGVLTTLVSNEKTAGRVGQLHLEPILDFFSCVFAAKWILNLPDNSLLPTEQNFSFPKDTGWLWHIMVSFGMSDQFGFGSDFLPWPSGFNPDDYPRGTWLFENIMSAWIGSMSGVASYVGRNLEADPPKSPQEHIDRTIRLAGGYPLPHSVHDLNRLVELTAEEPAEAMAWVWADQWSPERLAQDLKNALLPVRLRLESLLIDRDTERLQRVPEGMVLDTVPLLRRLVRRLLRLNFGDDWLRDAVPLEEQKKLAGLLIDNHREGTDFDYAELPLLQKLVEKHWAGAFEPFLIHYAKSTNTKPLRKKALLSELSELVPIRNAAAHRRRMLRPAEGQLANRAYERVANWLNALDGYSPPTGYAR